MFIFKTITAAVNNLKKMGIYEKIHTKVIKEYEDEENRNTSFINYIFYFVKEEYKTNKNELLRNWLVASKHLTQYKDEELDI